MWPFKSQPGPNLQLEERMEKLERKVRDIQVDWELTYEKFQKLAARLAKRAERAEEAAQEPPGHTNGDSLTIRNPLAAALLGRK